MKPAHLGRRGCAGSRAGGFWLISCGVLGHRLQGGPEEPTAPSAWGAGGGGSVRPVRDTAQPRDSSGLRAPSFGKLTVGAAGVGWCGKTRARTWLCGPLGSATCEHHGGRPPAPHKGAAATALRELRTVLRAQELLRERTLRPEEGQGPWKTGQPSAPTSGANCLLGEGTGAWTPPSACGPCAGQGVGAGEGRRSYRGHRGGATLLEGALTGQEAGRSSRGGGGRAWWPMRAQGSAGRVAPGRSGQAGRSTPRQDGTLTPKCLRSCSRKTNVSTVCGMRRMPAGTRPL